MRFANLAAWVISRDRDTFAPATTSCAGFRYGQFSAERH
jgi:hypothetical protein